MEGHSRSSWPTALTAAAIFLVALPAYAQPDRGLVLRPGEEVVLRPNTVGGWRVESHEKVGNDSKSQWEESSLASLTRPDWETSFKPSPNLPELEAKEDGTVKVRFRRGPEGNGAALIISNGFPLWFRYSADIRRSGDFQFTDVCEVLSNRRGTEYWPYPIAEIRIDQLRLLPDVQRPAVCDDAPDALPPIYR